MTITVMEPRQITCTFDYPPGSGNRPKLVGCWTGRHGSGRGRRANEFAVLGKNYCFYLFPSEVDSDVSALVPDGSAESDHLAYLLRRPGRGD